MTFSSTLAVYKLISFHVRYKGVIHVTEFSLKLKNNTILSSPSHCAATWRVEANVNAFFCQTGLIKSQVTPQTVTHSQTSMRLGVVVPHPPLPPGPSVAPVVSFCRVTGSESISQVSKQIYSKQQVLIKLIDNMYYSDKRVDLVWKYKVKSYWLLKQMGFEGSLVCW